MWCPLLSSLQNSTCGAQTKEESSCNSSLSQLRNWPQSCRDWICQVLSHPADTWPWSGLGCVNPLGFSRADGSSLLSKLSSLSTHMALQKGDVRESRTA